LGGVGLGRLAILSAWGKANGGAIKQDYFLAVEPRGPVCDADCVAGGVLVLAGAAGLPLSGSVKHSRAPAWAPRAAPTC